MEQSQRKQAQYHCRAKASRIATATTDAVQDESRAVGVVLVVVPDTRAYLTGQQSKDVVVDGNACRKRL